LKGGSGAAPRGARTVRRKKAVDGTETARKTAPVDAIAGGARGTGARKTKMNIGHTANTMTGRPGITIT
jgi:hypothetical protein